MSTVKKQVHQVLATLGYGDAIGNEAIGIQRILRAAGYESRIYVQTADPRVEHFTNDYHELVADSDEDNILIHHFSIGSRASRVAYALPDRMILIYHNITPPHYFIDVNHTLVQQCFSGRRELTAYIDRCDLALGDSTFNQSELEQMGFPVTGVLPVIPDFEHLNLKPNPLLSDCFDDEWTNILFVGRVIPNKRIEDVIRFVHTYQTRYNPKTRLLLVGSHDGFADYHATISALIGRLGTHDVHLIGHVSNEELTSIYDIADIFLSASEHEGFCVPLIEAFYKEIPVLAFHAAAVPSTMDGAGVLYEHKDPRHVASLMHAVLSDNFLADEIIRSQNEALERLQAKNFSETLLDFIGQVSDLPRKPPPVVAWDFWKQFDLSEKLDELRQYRPAIFQALPEDTPST